MRTILVSIAVVMFAFACVGPDAGAQREQRPENVPKEAARQLAEPQLVSFYGEVLAVNTEPCRTLDGDSQAGTYLIMKTSDAKTLSIHLGPAHTVEFVAKDLSRGQKVKVEAFRTDKREMEPYTARSLTLGERTVLLRDKDLSPAWARAKILEGRPGKVAVTAAEPSLDAALDPRFGRSPHFFVVDIERGTVEVFKNSNLTSGGGAGAQSAEMIASQGAKVVLTGKCGANASRALSAARVQVVSGCSGTVRELIQRYQDGKLKQSRDSSVAPHSGSGRRSSPNRGRGRRSAP